MLFIDPVSAGPGVAELGGLTLLYDHEAAL